MKKILFLILSVAFIQIASAQTHVIEVIGRGVLNEANPEISYDPTDVVKVEVEAIYFNADGITPDPVFFNGQEVAYSDVDIHYSVGATVYANEKGYYRAELTSLPGDGKVNLNKNSQGNHIVSFYVYVYRNRDGLPYSLINPESEIAFLHAKGDGAFSVEAEFSLEAATGLRDITITVPISDNEHEGADDRIGIIKLRDNGDVLKTLTFALNTGLDNFYLQKVEINDVQPEVEDVTVEIYSPVNPPAPEPRVGDSFFAGTILMDVEEEEEEDPGCTLTWGYWKTHADPSKKKYDSTWDNVGGQGADFFDCGQTYKEVMKSPSSNNAYYIMAHQFIAVELNEFAGADMSEVQTAFDAAKTLLNTYCPEDIEGLKGDDPLRKQFVDWGEILDDFNMGEIGPGHCDDGEEIEREEEIVEISSNKKNKNKSGEIEAQVGDKLTVYPNPVRGTSTISFKTPVSGRFIVDIYNATGQRMNRLMDRNVNEGIPVNLSINGQDYREGLYLLRVQNENSTSTVRVQISR